MKKILLAAAICSITLVASCKNGAKESDNQQTADVVERVNAPSIAYLNIDSLMMNYDMYKELQADFEVKAKKAGDNINARGSKLQRDIADFQDKVQKVLVTRAQAAQMEEALMKRQQDFTQYSSKIQSELGEEETVILNRIHHSITEYIREFNSGYRYSMIISSSASTGPIMDADPSLNITDIIIEGLNKKFAASKKP